MRGEVLQDFRKFIYHPMDVEEFERWWDEFKCDHKINESDLTEIGTRKAKDMWLLRMYDLRSKWSAAYTRGRTFLGMQINQHSESLNSMLHNHLDRQMSLVDLVEHYEFCLVQIRRKEIELDVVALGSIPFHDSSVDTFEKEAALIFTPVIFLKIREQIRSLAKWEVSRVGWDEDNRIKFKLSSLGEGEQLEVHVSCRFEGSLITNARCRCGLLESQLIPRAHIFIVLRNNRVDNIPSFCAMERWTM
jgi:hypothetical protein